MFPSIFFILMITRIDHYPTFPPNKSYFFSVKNKINPYHLTRIFLLLTHTYFWGIQTQNHRAPLVSTSKLSHNFLHITEKDIQLYIPHQRNLDCILKKPYLNHWYIIFPRAYRVFIIIINKRIAINIIIFDRKKHVLTQSFSAPSHL